MKSIIVRENKVPLYVGSMLLGFGLIILPLVILSEQNGNDTVLAGYIMVCIFALSGLFMLLDYALRRFTIEGNNCCYRTMFGRKRKFTLQDIKCARITVGSDTTIRLYNHDGKKLLRIEGNMPGSDDVLDLLERRGIPLDIKAAYLGGGKSIARQESREEKQKELTRAWKENPFYYQTPPWVRRVRLLLTIMNVAGAVLAVLAWLFFSMKNAGLVYMCCPLAFYIVYLMFHRIIADHDSKDDLSNYVKFPWLALCLIVIFSLGDSQIINFRDEWSSLLFVPVIGIVFILPFIIVVRPPRPKGVAVGMVFFGLAYGLIGMHYLNWICRTQPPEHETAFVLGTDVHTGSRRTLTKYYVDVERKDGTAENLQVSSALLNSVEPMDTVQICKRVSVFGIKYWYVHL